MVRMYGAARFLVAFVLPLLFFVSCSDEVDEEHLYVFRHQNISQYVRSDSRLALFSRLMERATYSSGSPATVSSLLGTRGHYTAFVPTDEAVRLYLDSLYGRDRYDVDTLPQSVVNAVVCGGVVDHGWDAAFRQTDLYEGSMAEGTLDGHHLMVRFGDFGDGAIVLLNGVSRVISPDIGLENGYVHIVDRVIPPAPNSLSGLIAGTGNLRVFSHLLEVTGWSDSLLSYRDKGYDEVYRRYLEMDMGNRRVPRYRLHGYTAFAEPDEVFHRDWGVPYPERDPEDGHVTNWDGIMSVISSRCAVAYPGASSDDYRSQDNAVNRFLSYHLVPYMEDYEHLAYHANEWGWWTRGAGDAFNINIWTYFQPMGRPRRLLKLTDVSRSGEKRLNRHSYYNNAFDGDYRESSCDHEGILVRADNGEYGNYAVNGYYYPIDHVLLYDDYVRDVVLDERIRYNICQTMPEMMSNRIRGRSYEENPYTSTMWKIPKGYCGNVETEGDWEYTNRGRNSVSYENSVASFEGETAVRLLPVPHAGIWEIRTCHPGTGIYHYYFGDTLRKDKMMDLGVRRIESDRSYLPPDGESEEDSVAFFDIVRGMRLHQIMPGPASYCWKNNSSIVKSTLRWASSRVIIGRFYMEPERTYYLRIQPLVNTGFQGRFMELNYIEMVPSSVYDNPNRAEDTW